jgi:hypothetical protein
MIKGDSSKVGNGYLRTILMLSGTLMLSFYVLFLIATTVDYIIVSDLRCISLGGSEHCDMLDVLLNMLGQSLAVLIYLVFPLTAIIMIVIFILKKVRSHDNK